MELLCSRADLSHAALLPCNRCRLSIEAVTLADIVSGGGKRITDDAATLQPVIPRPSSGSGHGRNPVPLTSPLGKKDSVFSPPRLSTFDGLAALAHGSTNLTSSGIGITSHIPVYFTDTIGIIGMSILPHRLSLPGTGLSYDQGS
jgi:hypothetical protein